MIRDVLRDSVRSLRQDRRGTLVSVCLLAVTIGAITAIYAIVHAVVLRPFEFVEQSRLAVMWLRDDRRALPIIEVSYGEMNDWRARSTSFDNIAVMGSVNWSLTLAGRTEPQPIQISAVSSSFFGVVGTPPLLGRGLIPADEIADEPAVMVISHGLWTRRFNRDPSIVGHAVPVALDSDGRLGTITVIGVMPPAFDFPRGAEAWLPAAPLIRKSSSAYGGPEKALRYLGVFFAVGRVRSGVTMVDAVTELTHVMRTEDRRGGPEPPQLVVVKPVADFLLGPAGPVLRTLLAGAALMLLIACVTVAGLQVARAQQRRRALAVRLALGASASRLVRQIVVESVLLTLAALAAAAIVATGIEHALMVLAPADVPRLAAATLADRGVLGFGAMAALITVTLCALWPAVAVQRADAMTVLVHGREAASPRGRFLQRSIVVVQVAVALTLLAGTALFLRTVRGLDQTVLGFDPDNLLTLTIAPQTADLDRWNAFYDALIERVRAMPHVVSASAMLQRPLNGPIGWDNQPFLQGQDAKDARTWGLNPMLNLEVVTPEYLKTMRIRLVRGRWFLPSDATNAPGVVVLSESAARRLWRGRDPLGLQLSEPSYRPAVPSSPPPWQTVVGIVEDARYRGLNDVRLDIYLPAPQSHHKMQYLMVRTDGISAGVVDGVRAAARTIDPDAQVSDATAMRAVVDAESAPWRFLMRVFIAFASLAATLAAVGLAAVVAMTVAARRRELAIRAALGADRRRLRGVIFGEAVWLVGAGVGLGICGALALGRGVAHVLIGVGAYDAPAIVSAAVVAGLVGLLASWLPARRAADADPLEAMRAE